MPQRFAAVGILVCLALAFVMNAQEPPTPPPAAQVELVAESEGQLSSYTTRLQNHLFGYASAAIAGIADSGEVRVRFRIRRDGAAQKPVLSLSSSKPALDDAALKAANEMMVHVEPLPAEVTRSFVDFQARFLFNQPAPQKKNEEGLSLAELARRRAKRPAESEKKVFTNDEVRPAAKPEPTTSRKGSASKSSSTATREKSSTSSKNEKGQSSEKPPELDPEHYRQRLQPLTEQLSQVKVEIDRVRYSSPQTTAGMPTISNTQKNELERLERKKAGLEKRIAAICEEAARNNVSVSSCPYY
jgi:TonB family protein